MDNGTRAASARLTAVTALHELYACRSAASLSNAAPSRLCFLLAQGGHLMSADFASPSDHHLANTRNDRVRYGTVAMAFHWTIAALVVTNIVLGIWFVNFIDRADPIRRAVVNWHESIGAVVLVLSILRLGWRLMNPIPALPADFSPAKRAFAHGTHYTLYA